MASPFVAGTAGLMLAVNPTLTGAQLKTCLTTQANATDVTASETGRPPAFGLREIRVDLAVNCARPTAGGGTITRPLGVDGQQPNGFSSSSTISADGRYITFSSGASNLVPGDTNNYDDVFVWDRQTGAVTRQPLGVGGQQPNERSIAWAISADGRYIAFWSGASNLVPGDTNNREDVFVWDRQTGAVTRQPLGVGGQQPNNLSFQPAISGDGRYITFASLASNLVPGDTNITVDVFVWDRQTGGVARPVGVDGQQPNSGSADPAISADGRYITFFSGSSNLVPGDTNNWSDVFVWDRQTGAVTRQPLGVGGQQPNNLSLEPAISGDGRYVTFYSVASNLVPGDTNNWSGVFVWDRQTGAVTHQPLGVDGQVPNAGGSSLAISADGRYITFSSGASNLVPGDTNNWSDVFVWDRQTGAVTRPLGVDGQQPNDLSFRPAISGDGRYITFSSGASNLVPGDTNNREDVFVWDRGG